jgi:hypothetical protein
LGEMTIIQRVYRAANMGLWALGVAFTLFLLLHIPQMRDARATAKARLEQEISEENRSYCEKWGLKANTHEHVICTMDLVRIRKETEQRIGDAMNF